MNTSDATPFHRAPSLPRYVERDRVWVNGEEAVPAATFEQALQEYCDRCVGYYPYRLRTDGDGAPGHHHHELEHLVQSLVEYPESFYISEDQRFCYSPQQLAMFDRIQQRLIERGAHDAPETEPIDTTVIAAFPGTGKTTAAATRGIRALDLDCTPYKYLAGVAPRSGGAYAFELTGDIEGLNPAWPANYCDAIEEAVRSGAYDYVLVCSDIFVLSTLDRRGIRFELFYPDDSQKDIYHRHFEERGDAQAFIDLYIGQ